MFEETSPKVIQGQQQNQFRQTISLNLDNFNSNEQFRQNGMSKPLSNVYTPRSINPNNESISGQEGKNYQNAVDDL